MWMFTRHGFYSVVVGRKNGKPDPEVMMVRARVREHLDNLIALIKSNVATGKPLPAVKESTDTDYRYRIVISQEQWVTLACWLADDVNYPNFKDAVKDGRYHDRLYRVWATMNSLQPPRPRPEPVDDDNDYTGYDDGHFRQPKGR